MVLFQGNNRIFDKPIVDTFDDVTGIRTLDIYGISSYNDLINYMVPVVSSGNGSNSEQIIINNLEAIDLKYCTDLGLSNVEANWVLNNQLYYITYNEIEDAIIVYAVGTNNGSQPTPDIETVTIMPSAILNLNNSSTKAQITNAFTITVEVEPGVYEQEDVSRIFSEAINTTNLISFTGTGVNTINNIFVIKTMSEIDINDNTNSIDSVVILDNVNNKIKKYSFTRKNNVDTISYDSVEVIETNIGGDIDSIFYWDGQSSTSNSSNIALFQKIYNKHLEKTCLILVKQPNVASSLRQSMFIINVGSLQASGTSEIKSVDKHYLNNYNSYSLIEFEENTASVTIANGTVSTVGAITSASSGYQVLRTDYNYSSYFTPTVNGHPATKKYVDDKFVDTDWQNCTDLASGAAGSSVKVRYKDGVLYFKGRMRSVNTYDPVDDVPIDVLQIPNSVKSYVTEEKHFAMLSSTDGVKPLRMMITTTGKIQIEYTDHATGNCNADFDNISLCI